VLRWPGTPLKSVGQFLYDQGDQLAHAGHALEIAVISGEGVPSRRLLRKLEGLDTGCRIP
jgi:hypothetical protein